MSARDALLALFPLRKAPQIWFSLGLDETIRGTHFHTGGRFQRDQREENLSFCCYIRGTRSRNSGSTHKFEEKIPAEDEDIKFETEGNLCGGSATEGVFGGG